MSAIRKKAAKMGVAATPTPVTTNRRTAPSTSKGGSKVAKNGNVVKKEKDDNQEGNTKANISTDDDDDGNTGASTPPEPFCSQDTTAVKTEYDTSTPATKTASSSATNKVIAGRVTKKRASPRKLSKTDYARLDDPFASMEVDTDGDGERVFRDDPISSEDSATEDGEFKGGEVEEDVAMEV